MPDAYAQLLRDVSATGGYSPLDAERYVVAVIATLEEKLPLEEVVDLEAQLPPQLSEILEEEPIADRPAMDARELCASVAARLGVAADDAVAIVRTVFGVLRAYISAREADHVEAHLSGELRTLWHGAEARASARRLKLT